MTPTQHPPSALKNNNIQITTMHAHTHARTHAHTHTELPPQFSCVCMSNYLPEKVTMELIALSVVDTM